ncbi:MAG: S66 family peptidase [Bacilli bacterium]
MIPKTITKGQHIRVIAPSRSMAILSEESKQIATERLTALGFTVSFGKHVMERNAFHSSSVASRIQDLHDAFRDPSVDIVMTVIGGFNSNQLLDYIDYDLIRTNPKPLFGYSDITAIQNAIYAQTGLVTFSGPHYSSFAMRQGFHYTESMWLQCAGTTETFTVPASTSWSDDAWYIDQDNRTFIPNNGPVVLQEGTAEGTILGGNLCTLNLLQGTKYMPTADDIILFVEDDSQAGQLTSVEFDRNLQSLLHAVGKERIRGLVIGRFQYPSVDLTVDLLREIVTSKRELEDVPVVCDVDFGHTTPMMTFPIGGYAQLEATSNVALKIGVTKGE